MTLVTRDGAGPSRRRVRRRRIGILAAAAGGALLVTQIALRADADTPAPTVTPGEAAAAAALVGAVPQASNLTLAVTAGQSDSAYNQTEDEATSGSVDLGGLGVVLANSPVCGSVFFTEQRQPPVTTNDSTNGSSTKTNDTYGQETATVSTSPEYAEATTQPVTQTVPGVMTISGQTQTVVRYVTDQEQEATASVDADISLAGGLVTMQGAKWTASIETGVKNSSSASFNPGTVSISSAGVPLPLPSADSENQVFTAVNQALSVVGLSIIAPTQTSDTNTGSLDEGPLDLHFSGSSLDNKVLSPIAQQLATLENVIAGQTADGSDCSQVKNLLGNLLTPSEEVSNILLAGAQGSGGVDLDLGGATVSTQAAPDFTDPFGSASSGSTGPASLPVTSSATPGSPASSSVGIASTGAVTGTGATVTSPSTTGATAPVTTPTRASRPSTGSSLIRCVSTSPARSPSCWNGLGIVAGAVAVAAGVGLLAADLVPSLAGGILPAGLLPAGVGRRSRRSNKRHNTKRRS